MFSGFSSSLYFPISWFCLLLFQRFAAVIHSVAINSSPTKHWVVSSSILYCHPLFFNILLCQSKVSQKWKVYQKFFNLIISQHQFLLNCFIRFKRMELRKDLHFSHHCFMGCSSRSKKNLKLQSANFSLYHTALSSK